MIPLIGPAVYALIYALALYQGAQTSLALYNAYQDGREAYDTSKAVLAGVGGLALVAILYAMSQKGGK